MFDIGLSELMLVALLGLLVLGPKRLPEVARTAGRWLGRLRRFVDNVRQDFDRELHSEELAELRKLKQELHNTRRIMEESSQQLFQDLSDDTGLEEHTIRPPQTPTATPRIEPTGKPSNRSKPVRRRKRPQAKKKQSTSGKKHVRPGPPRKR